MPMPAGFCGEEGVEELVRIFGGSRRRNPTHLGAVSRRLSRQRLSRPLKSAFKGEITLSVLHHHMAHYGVVLQRVGTEIFAVAGLLQPAVRHLADQHEMAVHPGAAIL